MSQLRARTPLSRSVPHVFKLSGVRALLFSRAGILRWGHDHQLRRYHGVRRGNFSGIALISRLHDTFDEHKNPAVDGLRYRFIFVVGAAFLQFLAGNRFLD